MTQRQLVSGCLQHWQELPRPGFPLQYTSLPHVSPHFGEEIPVSQSTYHLHQKNTTINSNFYFLPFI